MSRSVERFVKAHNEYFQVALSEVKAGKKRSHWMWFIFPQLQGLGHSETSRFYAIENLAEAATFLAHPMLGSNITIISTELLQLDSSNASHVFGSPDYLKLQSSMTLLSLVPGSSPVFEQVLRKFFHGEKDQLTLKILS